MILRRVTLVLLGVLLIRGFHIGYAQGEVSENLRQINHVGGRTIAIASEGNTVYFGQGSKVGILDVSTSEPVLLGMSEELAGEVTDIVVVDQYLYVAADDFAIIDVTTPEQPIIVSQYETAGYSVSLEVSNDVAYIGNQSVPYDDVDPFVTRDILLFLDISDRSNPIRMGGYEGTLSVGNARVKDVTVHNENVYVATGFTVVNIDISRIEIPRERQGFSTAGRDEAVTVVGDFAYVAGGYQGGIGVFDVSDPDNPVKVGENSTITSIKHIEVVGDYAYATAEYEGLIVYDVSDLANPQQIGQYDTQDFAWQVIASDNRVFVADTLGGVVAVDVSLPSEPTLHAIHDNSMITSHLLEVVDDFLYTGAYRDIDMLNIVDATEVKFTNHFTVTENRLQGVAVNSPFLYAVAGWSLNVLDTSLSSDPMITSVRMNGAVTDVIYDEETLFIGNATQGLTVVDVSNVSEITVTANLTTGGSVQDIEIVDTLMYVVDGDFKVIDVSQPTNPQIVGSLIVDGNNSKLTVHSDGYAYVIDENEVEFAIVDVTNAESPTITGSFVVTGNINTIELVEPLAFVGHDNGIAILDVTNPVVPVLIEEYETGMINHIKVIGRDIYAAGAGLHVYETELIEVPGDRYELDNSCGRATPMSTNGLSYQHTFHDENDVDWLRFDVEEGNNYLISGHVPAGSDVNLVPDLYMMCNSVPSSHELAFTTGFQFAFPAPADGTIFLRLANSTETFGDDATYSVSVTEQAAEPQRGAVIIVAGSQVSGDILQDNIYSVTNNVYKMFREQGYADDEIFYLAPDATLDPMEDGNLYVDRTASIANLEYAITTWAESRVSDSQALTLYLMSHGDRNRFYLNHENGDELTTTALDTLLSTLEDKFQDLSVNIIIDACHSGSFIEPRTVGDTLSRAGRVVVTSSATDQLAWASDQGSMFSDYFITALRQRHSLKAAFDIASAAVTAAPYPQQPWLDDNGNGVPSSEDVLDGIEASQRGFRVIGSFGDVWQPWISEASLIAVDNGIATLRVHVRDDDEADGSIEHVWLQLYPPSYRPPSNDTDLLVDERDRVIDMTLSNDGYYEVHLPLAEIGTYRAVIYARDYDELLAEPKVVEFENTTVMPLNMTHHVTTISVNRPNTQIILLICMIMSITTGAWFASRSIFHQRISD